MEDILKIKDLNVKYYVYGGYVKALTNFSLTIRQGEVYALVGESGCGKSTVANTILGLNDATTTQTDANILSINEHNLLKCSEKDMEGIRANLTGMIFQDPQTSLNPTMKIGKQIVEAIYRRRNKTSKECKEEAIRLLRLVQIPEAEMRYEQYPHQLSGGMKQRVVIAMSIAMNPQLLIADEPTTSLDVTTQASILELLKDIKETNKTSLLFITHDFGVVANIADRIGIMYAGEIVEEGNSEDIFYKASHPYTQSLLKCLPDSKEKNLVNIPGEPPDLFGDIIGCPFVQRCDYCMNICLREKPKFEEISQGHFIKCFRIYK